MRVLIFGCGYLGLRAAVRWQAAGHTVTAVTRSPERAGQWASQGIQPLIGDVTDRLSLQGLPAADLCLYAVGYDRRSGQQRKTVSLHGLENVVREISSRVQRLLFISSTSVYGQTRGEIVHEESACEPESESGNICLEAEQIVRSAFPLNHSGPSAVILRLAGLYGPGRMIARAQQLRNREPMTSRPDSWLNLIHVDDATETLVRLAERDSCAPLSLVSDGSPVLKEEFYTAASRLIGAPPPVFQPDNDSLNKRCDSSRIRAELQLSFRRFDAPDGLPTAMVEQLP